MSKQLRLFTALRIAEGIVSAPKEWFEIIDNWVEQSENKAKTKSINKMVELYPYVYAKAIRHEYTEYSYEFNKRAEKCFNQKLLELKKRWLEKHGDANEFTLGRYKSIAALSFGITDALIEFSEEKKESNDGE